VVPSRSLTGTGAVAEARKERAEATRRLGEAQQAIGAFGPLGRRIHRREVEENEYRIARATADVDRTEKRIEGLEAESNRLAENIPAWRRWQEKFGYAADRLRTLEFRLALTEPRHEVGPGGSAERGPEYDAGMEVGL